MNKLLFLLLTLSLCMTIDAFCARCEPWTRSPSYVCEATCACANKCPAVECSPCPKTCSKGCGCQDPECACLKAALNFPEVDYPMCAVEVRPFYF